MLLHRDCCKFGCLRCNRTVVSPFTSLALPPWNIPGRWLLMHQRHFRRRDFWVAAICFGLVISLGSTWWPRAHCINWFMEIITLPNRSSSHVVECNDVFISSRRNKPKDAHAEVCERHAYLALLNLLHSNSESTSSG